MTARDRYVIAVVGAVGVLGAFWFLGLSPKRHQVAKLDKDIVAAQQSLQTAQQEKTQFAQAQVHFPALYSTVGQLGKAVPADEDIPSLLVQLNHAASRSGVDFRSIQLKAEKTEAAAAPAPAAGAAADSSAPAAGAPAESGSGGAAPAAAASATAAAPASAGAEPAAADGTATATATATAAATLQPLPFEYKFEGDFFDLKKVIGAITDLVETRNREVAVSGRLISVDGFTMKKGKVTLLGTSYMLPAGQSLFAGADPQGPVGVDPNAPQPASTPSGPAATPTAAVTSP